MSLIFAPEVTIQLPTHEGLPEKKRPVYVFSAGSRKQTLQLAHARAEWGSKSYDDVVNVCASSVRARLLRVEVNGRSQKSKMDLEDTLTDEQIVELFTGLSYAGVLSISDKKKSKSQPSSNTESSAADATPPTVTK